jgi:hypothetical protein
MAERKRRRGRVLLVLLLVVIVLLVAADRVGVVIAEHQIADQASEQLAAQQITTSEKPSVSIRGVPFLTQVAAGHYQEIDINLEEPTSRGVRLDDLKVVATDVDAPASGIMGGNPHITAAKVTGVAHIGWASFERLVDLSGLGQYGLDPKLLRIDPVGPGKIKVSGPVTILGASFTAVATGTVNVREGAVHVGIDSIQASGDNIAPAINQQLDQLKNQLTFDIKIPPLPYKLSVESIATNAQGVLVNASARDVTLAS